MNLFDEKAVLLRISYHGFSYHGWSMQKNLPTIEEELRKTWLHVFGNPVRAFAASRTDAHVHALDQWVKIMSKVAINVNEDIIRRLNDKLPSDIRALEFSRCPKGFNIIGAPIAKEYSYLFANELPSTLVNSQEKVFHIIEKLDFDLMSKAAEIFIGSHSFHNYQRREKSTAKFFRHINSSELSVISNWQGVHLDKKIYCYTIKSKGFLRQMVRIIVGAILNVGQGKKSIDDLINSLKENGDTKQHAGFVSPGHGLYLRKIYLSNSTANDNASFAKFTAC